MPEKNETEQIVLMQRLVEMSAERSYMNAERTLSVWIRTALALMIFGIAIDRFGLLLHQLPLHPVHSHINPNTLSDRSGIALVGFGVLMALTTGIRFLAYAAVFSRNHKVPVHHGPYLASMFALLVVVFGIGLLVILLVAVW